MPEDTEEEAPWQLPPRFHTPKGERNKQQAEILSASDAQQAEWSAMFAQPQTSATPLDRWRGRATIIIREYTELLAGGYRLKRNQREELGEAYAAIGRYDLAFKATWNKELREEYIAIWNAIQRDDSEVCECGTGRTFSKKDVFSIFHGATVSLVKCGNCDHLNAVPTPAHITDARAVRSKIRNDLTGLHPLDAKAQMIEMRANGEIA